MQQNMTNAENYFRAFSEGNIPEAESYFTKKGVVIFGEEKPKAADVFCKESAKLVANTKFEYKSTFASQDSGKILLYFSYQKKGEEIKDSVDVIEFDNEGKIKSLQVIPA